MFFTPYLYSTHVFHCSPSECDPLAKYADVDVSTEPADFATANTASQIQILKAKPDYEK